MEQFVSVAAGKRLFVDVRGPADAPALLYLHAGPGQGAYEFMAHQGDRLSRHLRVVGLDQRGVLRSDPLDDDEPLGIQDLVEDCEAVRTQLGIERWSILGNSFGGYLGLLYALAYPEAVERMVFENPSWDPDLSARSLLRGAAALYREAGETEKAEECLAVAAGTQDSAELYRERTRLTQGLGERRRWLFIYRPETRQRIHEAVEAAPFPREWWLRGQVHQRKLFAEGRIWESVLPLLPQLRWPALLIKGQRDHVPSEAEVEAFLSGVPNGRMVVFEDCGHYVHAEDPDRFAKTVVEFLLAQE